MNGILQGREKSRKVMARGTVDSVKHVIYESTGAADEELRAKYCKPLDSSDAGLQASGRKREDYGQDAIRWGNIVEQEVGQESVNIQLLRNMCLLLAADCEGVARYSGIQNKRDQLRGMKEYFEKQAEFFYSKIEYKVNAEMKGAALAFSEKCKRYTKLIVEYSKYKPKQAS